jgi:GNAT superfamily N-acetyltransferase
LPPGYRYAQFGRADIAPLISSLKAWYPSMTAGANSCYLREDFYLKRVGLDGDVDHDVIGIRIMRGEALAGFWSFEREVDSLAIWGRLLVVAPEHRGAKVSVHALSGAEGIGRAMGAAFLYAFAPLSTPYVQQGLERAGYRLLGFFPGRDREEVAPGIVKRVYQAVYARLLAPEDQVHWPDPRKMTPRAREMYGLLFPERRLG